MTAPLPLVPPDFQRFVEHAPLFAWVSDEHGRMLYVNENVRNVILAGRPFVPGTPIVDTYPASVADKYFESDRLVLETNAPVERREPATQPDGSPGVVLVKKFPLGAHSGVRLIGGIAIDITAQLEQERKLRIAEDRFARMVDVSSEGVWWVDAEWRTTFVNPALEKMLGFSKEEMLGKTVLDFVPEAAREEVLAMMRDREDGVSSAVDTPLQRKDRTVCWTSSSSHVLQDGGKFVGAFALLTDITARREAAEAAAVMEARLRETQRLESLGVLAGGVAHDFNNLLAGVLANLDLVALDVPEEAEAAHESLKLARDAARRAATLTRQLLAYAGKNRLAVRRTDLVSVVRATCDILGKGRVRVELALEPTPQVIADQGELGQAALNIVLNAVEALGNGPGAVRVKTGVRSVEPSFLAACVGGGAKLPDAEYVVMEVDDDGPGIEPDVASRIFEPFYTTKGPGRGLGLSATLGIVRAHGGAIHLRTAAGNGTTFTLLLPVAPPESLDAADEVKAGTKSALEHGTVLLVDDDNGVRRAAMRLLEVSGYRAIECSGGREAIETYRARGREIDTVLLDLRMPEMDGEETLRQLVQMDPDVRVVLWSGFAEPELVDRLTSTGAVAAFVPKPFEAVTLLDAVALAARRVS